MNLVIRASTAASFKGACELNDIGVPAIVTLMEAMLHAPEAIGARQDEDGFGGCMVAFVRAGIVKAFSQSVDRAYRVQTGLAPEVCAVERACGAEVPSLGSG